MELQTLYDPQLFDQAARAVLEECTRYLERVNTAPYPALKPLDRPGLVRMAGATLDDRPVLRDSAAVVSRARELARLYLDGTNPLQSRHYLGHQVPPPVPLAAAFQGLMSIANQGTAVMEMSPFGIGAEMALGTRLASYLGWSSGFGSVVVSGGSLANLTALLAARNTHFPGTWRKGLPVGRRPAILTSGEAHYSIARAAGTAGLGSDSVFKLPLDGARRVDPSKLEETFERATREGFEPFCLVSSSCSTPIGAFDPIGPMAEFARRRGLWLHVDAAHGGGLLVSRRHRAKPQGAEQADSIIWDAHKMMFVPALCTYILYKDEKKSYAPFEQDAPYLFDRDADDAMAYDPGLRTLECTKGPLAVALWALWSLFGPETIEALVDRVIERTRQLHGLIGESGDFVAAHEPECNILCFRHLPRALEGASPERISSFQLKLRQALLKTGRFFITGTSLDGVYALRTTVINPATGETEFRALLDELRALGRALL